MSERWLQTPNLPKKKITLGGISEKAHSVRRALVSLDIRCMPVPCCRDLAGPVASHADMLLHHLENEHFLMAQGNRRLHKRMEREKGEVRLLSRKLAPFYPHDVLLNVFRLGQHCFGLETCAAEIRSFCEENNLLFHPVRQGYAKCSTVLVNEQGLHHSRCFDCSSRETMRLGRAPNPARFCGTARLSLWVSGWRQRKTFSGCVGLCRQSGHTPGCERDSCLSSQPSCLGAFPAGRTLVGFGRNSSAQGRGINEKGGLQEAPFSDIMNYTK